MHISLNVWVLVLAAIVSIESASAREFAGGRSYMGSGWQKARKLPYERCSIRHSLDGSSYRKFIWSDSYTEFSKPSAGFFVQMKDEPPVWANYYLTCWTGVNNYAWAVKIHPGKLNFTGASLGLMGSALKFEFLDLHGKTLADVEGEYSGRLGGAGLLFAGFRRGMFKNEAGIRLWPHGWFAGLFGVQGGIGTLEIGLGAERNILIDKTDADKETEIADLTEYTFEKTNWNTPEPVIAAPPPAAPAAAGLDPNAGHAGAPSTNAVGDAAGGGH